MSIYDNGILNDYNTQITLLDQVSAVTPDEYGGIGGIDYSYRKGAVVTVQLVPQQTLAAKIAEAVQEKQYFTVIVDKGINLIKGQVFQKNSDKSAYRITESNTEHETPASAGLQFSYAKAERFEIPADTPIIEPVQTGV